jgi:hypothetical protein
MMVILPCFLKEDWHFLCSAKHSVFSIDEHIDKWDELHSRRPRRRLRRHNIISSSYGKDKILVSFQEKKNKLTQRVKNSQYETDAWCD